ncbi:MAG: flagellar biosynthetic protein FliR [Planctomycetes bacterium]|nr:flagellar biosynthetic protein FliR [Planctomycetota bacterium]
MAPDALHLLLAFGPSVVLHVVRATAFLAALPVLGEHVPSRALRLVLGIAIGAAVFQLAGTPVVSAPSLPELGLLAAREALIGALAGFAVQCLFAVVAVAGELVGQEMGLTMSRVLDPSSGRQDATLTVLLQTLAFLLFLQLDLHHDVLRVLLATYDHVPVGHGFELAGVVAMLQSTIAAALALGVRLVAPVLALLLLTTVVLVVLARAIPNLNLLEFSFGFRILVALAALLAVQRFAWPFLAAVLRDQLGGLTRLFAGT